jgi:16S rRNA (guanine527-N7)-methyltransferase
VIRSRAEDHDRRYDVVAARALAPLDRLVGWCNPLRAVDGVILALKGSSAADEVAAQPSGNWPRRSLDAEVLLVRAHPDAEPATVVRLQSLLSQRDGD